MSIICHFFSHRWRRPEFNVFTADWEERCVRCDEYRKGTFPAQHTHNYGKKYRRDGKWMWDCACGYATDAPVPVRRKAKAAIDEKKG